MKNVSVVLSTLSFVGVLILFGLYFGQNKKGIKNDTATVAAPGGALKVAYVNIDSLEAHFEVLKNKNIEFKKKKEDMINELQRSYQQMQNDEMELQKKAQANTLTKAEYDAAQKRLGQMQQSFETRKEAMNDQLMEEQEGFSNAIKKHLKEVLTNYNKDKHYDYIFSYTDIGTERALLMANKQLDITDDVIKGMNSTPMAADDAKKSK